MKHEKHHQRILVGVARDLVDPAGAGHYLDAVRFDMKAISLGWGVQSFTLAAMVALGELPSVDVAIHADTTHERSQTYKFAERWMSWLEKPNLRIITVTNEKARPMIDRWGGLRIPAYTITNKGNGQVRRQCTHEWCVTRLRTSSGWRSGGTGSLSG